MHLVLFTLSLASNVQELIPHIPVEVSVKNDKYIFDGVEYNAQSKIGVVRGQYTFKNIPAAHPFTFVDVEKEDSIEIVEFDTKTIKTATNVAYYSGNLKVNFLPSFTKASYECSIHGPMGSTDGRFFRMHGPKLKDSWVSDLKKTAGSTSTVPAIIWGVFTFLVLVGIGSNGREKTIEFIEMNDLSKRFI